MINSRTLGFGLVFGLIDSIALPVIKSVSLGASHWWMLVPVVLYASSPFVFLKALEKETLTIMNLVWDLTSDLVVTFIGLAIFAERLPPTKLLGVFFSFIGLFLMTYEGNGWNEYLSENVTRIRNRFTGIL
jgi:drug/metabolite transporter (DMT)-like permease